MHPIILVSESRDFSKEAAGILARAAEVRFLDSDRAQLLASAGDADVLWVRLRHRIDRDVMAAAPRLSAIATPTTGLNHIDMNEAKRRGIRILSLKGETEFLRTVSATAEHTMALLLALVRQIPGAVAHAREGGWNRDLFRGNELRGKTAGIVGYGRIGRMMARYLTAFGMRVLAADPRIDPAEMEQGVALETLESLLPQCDVVTLHADFSDRNRGFFDAHAFSRMKPGAWFVNTARGELVDEGALLEALQSGKVAGAAVDVLCDESSSGMEKHPLTEYARLHANLIVTPHIAGCTWESMEKTEVFLAGRVAEYLKEGALAGAR